METVERFLVYYNLVLLLLLPLALCAWYLPYLERILPRLVFWLGISAVSVVVLMTAMDCIWAVRDGSWSGKTWLHLSAAVALCYAAWAKFRTRGGWEQR